MKTKNKLINGSILSVMAGMLLLGSSAQRAAAGSLLWSAEFNNIGAAPGSADWSYQTGGGGWGNGELEIYTTDLANAQCVSDADADGGGSLFIKCTTGNGQWNGQWYSARINSNGKHMIAPGSEVKFRCQCPAGPGGAKGYWPACWMLGTINNGNWPACGEIDVMEEANGDNTIHQSLHMPGWDPTVAHTLGNANNYFPCSMDWPADCSYVQFWLNGTSYATFTRAACPGTWAIGTANRFYILLNVAIGGASSGFTGGGPNSSTVVGRGMHVDWVRHFSYP